MKMSNVLRLLAVVAVAVGAYLVIYLFMGHLFSIHKSGLSSLPTMEVPSQVMPSPQPETVPSSSSSDATAKPTASSSPTTPQTQTAPVTVQATVQDPVIARVDGKEIHQSEVKEHMAGLDQETLKNPPQALVNILVDREVNTQLLLNAARSQNLENNSLFQKRMGELKDQALIESYLAPQIDRLTTESKLKARYEQWLKENPPQEEAKASHILTKTEAEAKDIISQLKGGADFTTLAKSKSMDPSALQNGGDLGFFSKDAMDPAFSKAVFETSAGTLIDHPIQSSFGWHVIKVEAKRMGTPPTYDQVKETLRKQIAQDSIESNLKQLKSSAHVELYQWDGSPLSSAPTPQNNMIPLGASPKGDAGTTVESPTLPLPPPTADPKPTASMPSATSQNP